MTGSLRLRPSALTIALFYAIIVNVFAWPVDNYIPSDKIRETGGPVIFPPQNEIVLQKGQNYTLYCKSKSEVQFKQQEVPEEVIGPFHTVQSSVESGEAARPHAVALQLVHVDEFAVGYYACFDASVNGSDVLANVVQEPADTEHISYIYIYVNGSDNLFAPMREVIIARSGADVVIECRPTAPDIKVNLLVEPQPERYSPKIGFVIDSDCLLDGPTVLVCEYTGRSKTDMKDVFVHKYVASPPPRPKVSIESKYFLEGETFSVNCTVAYQTNSAVMLIWKTPRALPEQETIITETNEQNVTDGMQYKNLTIVNATRKDAGRYTCLSKNAVDEQEASFNKIILDKGFINLTKENRDDPVIASVSPFVLLVKIQAYPKADYVYYKNNKELLINGNPKYSLSTRLHGSSIVLSIKNMTVYDTANYTLVAKNKYIEKSINFDLRVPAAPSVDFGPDTDKRYLLNSAVTLKCDVVGYPLPEVKWYFKPFYNKSQVYENKGKETELSPYKVASYLDIEKVSTSGNITCKAINRKGSVSSSRRFLVYEMPNGFGIDNPKKLWVSQHENVVLTCLASIYDFENVSWVDAKGENMYDLVEKTVNAFSYVAKLRIDFISLDQAGNYTCIGARNNGSTDTDSVSITVAEIRTPVITEPPMDMDVEVYPYQPLQLTCIADSVPTPTVEWFRDGDPIESDSNVDIITEAMSHTTVNSTIIIHKMLDEYKGKYECVTTSLERTQERFFNIIVQEKSAFKMTHLSIIIAIFVILLILVIYLFWKIKKEKQFRKELAAAGLLYFKEGVAKSLNPDLGIDEQAELLPYDDKFEFPPEKLKLGKQLGAGAFGVVYKAEARGIVNAEESTTVAVKMVKKTADNMFIKALASELKIMVHLGKHINIVNLLGACTKNVGKRELIVIVEYCKFGNIHNYMQKHREVFIDQFSDNKDKNFGRVNRGFSCSNPDSGSVSGESRPQQHSEAERNQSDYFGFNTPDTGHTFLNTANTNRSSRKVSETGYVQPEWRSNYESDYSYDGRSPRPLCSRDLLCWAFQIARGMEYLASRKVLHGDLAARNILLADDNVVKICDFGLARSIYKNDEYHQKGSNPVPIKWLAIECLTDRIFSTQSDVWAFGVVLWELFTLAKTPYPSISHTNLLQFLNDGNRLDRPPYSDDRLYNLMQRCWDQKPTARPTFSQLQETLGSFLEDNVRNHYVDLNAGFLDTNMTTKAEAGEDYLAMVCAPDYNNLVTPSPHHYVNDVKSFFPPTPTLQLQHDDEGYLQMSPATNQAIFSSRAPGSKFDFDARKLNPELNVHSELTPMLSLNNLPARGSESDQEGGGSPYLNMCPRIDEEADEVFQTKNNIKNISENCAVTNPTYITFDVDIEKKPRDDKVCNRYVNTSVPNGLVN